MQGGVAAKHIKCLIAVSQLGSGGGTRKRENAVVIYQLKLLKHYQEAPEGICPGCFWLLEGSRHAAPQVEYTCNDIYRL